MQISEIRIKLVENPSDRLKAFCTVTFENSFVVRDLKIIEGSGGYFVAMPSRKLTDHCPSCGAKNHLRAKFCNDCGGRLDENRSKRGPSRTKLHADIAHPVNTESREMIQESIIEAYQDEVERSKQPGYEPTQLDDEAEFLAADQSRRRHNRPVPDSPPPTAAPQEQPAESAEPAEAESESENSGGFSDGIL